MRPEGRGSPGPRVALATAAPLPDLDEDGPALLAALLSRGVTGVPAVWDDEGVRWGNFDLVVVRSTWDYPERRDRFVGWARAVEAATDLANDAAIIEWNTDKHYLEDLRATGIPIVPTTWLEPGDPVDLPGGLELVLKPAVSAGARDALRVLPGHEERAARHVGSLHALGRSVMVQPYLRSVDRRGETAMLFFDGRFSHAVRKGPLLRPGAEPEAGLYTEEDVSPHRPTAAERSAAEAVLDAVPFDRAGLLYARIDLVEDQAGRPLVLECELSEPSMFLQHHPAAPERMADAIARRLRHGRAARTAKA